MALLYSIVYRTICMFLKVFISSSFGSQLSQEFGRAVSEPYVRTHITEPPCLTYIFAFLTKAEGCSANFVMCFVPSIGRSHKQGLFVSLLSERSFKTVFGF